MISNERKQVTEMSQQNHPPRSLRRKPTSAPAHVLSSRRPRQILTFAATRSGSARRLRLLISTAACSGALALLAAPTSLAAKTFSLNENGDLHLTSKQGFTLNEQGPASGTVSGTLYVHLKIVSSTRVTAEISLYPHGGSITCSGSAAYKREGSIANFSGALSIDRGTGSYAKAHGSGLSFSGTIQRSNDAITVHVGGTASD
jgi:hypothetical protein